MTRFAPTLRLAALGAALALGACDDRGQARIDAPDPEPLSYLAASSELPYAEPAPVNYYAPQEGYRWAERAYGLQRAFYDVPPDYGFEYGGVEPLVWVSEDDWSLYAEPWDDGYRYYYYEPGTAYPYFVLAGDYGYGFGPTGILVAVFDIHGAYLPREVVYRMAPVAGRYYLQGRDLRNAALQSRRITVTRDVWADAGPRVTRSADRWMRAARDDRTWRQWRERDGDRELRRFNAEQRRREDIRVASRHAPIFPPVSRPAREQRQDERFASREARRVAQVDRRASEARGRAEARLGHGQGALARRHTGVEAQADGGRQRVELRRQERQAAAMQAERGRQQQARAEQRAQQEARAQQRAQQQEARAAAAREQAQAGRAEAQQQARAAQQQARPAAARERGARTQASNEEDPRERGKGRKE